MQALQGSYASLFVVTALISFYGAYRATETVDRDTRTGLVAVFVLAGSWAVTSAIRLSVDWVQLAVALRIGGLIIGLASIGAWLYFASAYSGLEYHRRPAIRWAAIGFYVIAVGIKITNPVYHLYFTTELSTQPFPHLSFNPGPVYWLIAGIAYLSVGVGLLWLIDAVNDAPTKDWRFLVILALTGIPAILDILITLSLIPEVVVDVSYAPIGMAVFALGTFVLLNETLRPISQFWRRQVLTQLNEAIVIVDGEARLRYVSQAAAKTFGSLEVGSEAQFEDVAPSLSALTYRDDPVFKWEDKDETRYYRVLETVLPNERVTTHYAFIYTEVTESERTKQELQRKSRVMDKAPIGITISEIDDGDSSLVYTNERFTKLTKHDKDTLLKDDQPTQSLAAVNNAIDDHERKTISIEEQRRDGTQFWNQITVAPILRADDTTSEYVAFHRDITDRKKNKRQLKQYKSAIEESPDWIVGVDTTGAILFANKSFRQFHGVDSETARGTPITELLEDAAEQIETAIKRALAGDSITFEHVTAGSTTEQERPVQNTVSPLRGEGGDISGAVLAVQDLSEIKQHERQLEVLDRILRHNLSNKMTVIGGYTEAIQHQTDDKDMIALTEQILTATSELNNLVYKQREITRVLTDSTPGKVVDLRQIVETSVSSMERTFPGANIRLDIPDNPVRVVGGPLGRAIEELLENAITHSDLATPSVSVRVWSEDGRASLAVSDDGPGIPEADQDVVAGTEKIQPLLHGQGLGLWLVKIIVDQTGGTLRFDDNDPRGTIVTMQLPLATNTVPLELTEEHTPPSR